MYPTFAKNRLRGDGQTPHARAVALLLALFLALFLVLSLAAGQACADVPWPEVALPRDVERFDMGGEIRLNGLALRMQGLLSRQPPAVVAAAFGASLGSPLARNAIGAKLVLGRPLGEFYVTVQLEPAGAGTRGVVAVARLATALAEKETNNERTRHILAGFPPDTKLLSRTTSTDGRRRNEFLTLSNAYGAELNTGHVKRWLGAQGYQPERTGASIPGGHTGAASRPASTLFFKRAGGEATAVIHADGSGSTSILINAVGTVEERK